MADTPKCPTCRKETKYSQDVFAKVECPVCLSDKDKMCALKCGHLLCKECCFKIGFRYLKKKIQHLTNPLYLNDIKISNIFGKINDGLTINGIGYNNNTNQIMDWIIKLHIYNINDFPKHFDEGEYNIIISKDKICNIRVEIGGDDFNKINGIPIDGYDYNQNNIPPIVWINVCGSLRSNI